MVSRIITFSLHNRLIVLSLAALLLVGGLVAARRSPLDIFPEFAPPQVVVQTEAPGLSAEEVEALVTIPLEHALNGTSFLTILRSSSGSGISVITAIFAEGSDILTARILVSERLSSAASTLPQGVGPPRMTPITSSTGTLLTIGLTAKSISPMELRTLADWVLRPRLLAVPGVAGVVVYGGQVREYQVLVSPERLRRFDLTLEEVAAASRDATALMGAGYLDRLTQRLPIRGDGMVKEVSDLQAALVSMRDGTPLTLGQVAEVRLGAALKVGDATVEGGTSRWSAAPPQSLSPGDVHRERAGQYAPCAAVGRNPGDGRPAPLPRRPAHGVYQPDRYSPLLAHRSGGAVGVGRSPQHHDLGRAGDCYWRGGERWDC